MQKGRNLRQGQSTVASLEHVIFYPGRTEEKYPAVVALHGRGANELDLIPLIQALGIDDLLVISARAPLAFNLVGGAFAWYQLSNEWVPNPATFIPSLEALRRFLSEVKISYPVDPNRLFLLGFSQGTIMSYAAALTDPSSVNGVAALSGYIPTKSGLSFKLDKMIKFPFFISHGSFDDIIPVRLGREACGTLGKGGCRSGLPRVPDGASGNRGDIA